MDFNSETMKGAHVSFALAARLVQQEPDEAWVRTCIGQDLFGAAPFGMDDPAVADAGAIDAPVSVMETAGEGGAWGIALLASYMINKEENETLEDYLDAKVFAGNAGTKMDPDPADVAGFEVFTERYKKGLPIERAAVENLK